MQYDLLNLDKDKTAEIEIFDGSTKGAFTSTADSSYGRVVMKFIDNEYRVAPELMKKPKPDNKKIKKIKLQIAKEFQEENHPFLPTKLLEIMMDLSYTGHFDLALKIAEETWPMGKKGLLEFKKDFTFYLHESKYWKEFSVLLNKTNK